MNIDLGVFVVWRITQIMLNIKPCSLDDKLAHNAVSHNAQKGGHVQVIPAADFHCIFIKSLIYF